MSLENTIQKFAERLGMPNLNPSPNGVLALDITDVGRLYLEILNDPERILIYLSDTIPAYAKEIVVKALDFCHYRHDHPYNVWCGIHKETFLLFTSLDESEATPQNIENAVLFLTEHFKKLISDH